MKEITIGNKPTPNQWQSNQFGLLLEQHVRGAGLAARVGGELPDLLKIIRKPTKALALKPVRCKSAMR